MSPKTIEGHSSRLSEAHHYELLCCPRPQSITGGIYRQNSIPERSCIPVEMHNGGKLGKVRPKASRQQLSFDFHDDAVSATGVNELGQRGGEPATIARDKALSNKGLNLLEEIEYQFGGLDWYQR